MMKGMEEALPREISADRMTTRELGPGESWRNPPLLVHTLEALEDSEIIEVSTPQVEDVVRLEDRYGRAPEAAPPKDEAESQPL